MIIRPSIPYCLLWSNHGLNTNNYLEDIDNIRENYNEMCEALICEWLVEQELMPDTTEYSKEIRLVWTKEETQQ